jgi:hypothetical protein
MGKQEQEILLSGKGFKRMSGVTEGAFDKMPEIQEAAYERQHKYGGKPRKQSFCRG